MGAKNSVVVKKVSAFPIEATFNTGGQFLRIKILKLNEIGFIAELENLVVKIRDEGDTSFHLPASDILIANATRVVKTYDRLRPVGVDEKEDASKIQYLAEFHFVDISQIKIAEIKKFLLKIGQK